ncbi:MAG TPA: helix-turn-helix transcriptional regulator [Candidatus Limnocylindrales bacterium]|nr:helix-turn-helix transcriptional regulator [Candidatus Limnocylindrales bacterium]
MPTRLQLDADRRAAAIRRSIADDLRQLRVDAGVSRVAVARVAGVDPSFITKMEAGRRAPSIETYVRIAAALGADFTARPYPNTGPQIRDRHQVRMAELLLASLHRRWRATPEVAVRRPARGWIDAVLEEPLTRLLVATELESDVRRVEQILRWSREKADSLPSATPWSAWAREADPAVSRLLVVRWTRANREVAVAARRQLREAYPADPRDALEALTGDGAWPGAAMIWARLEGPEPRLFAA